MIYMKCKKKYCYICHELSVFRIFCGFVLFLIQITTVSSWRGLIVSQLPLVLYITFASYCTTRRMKSLLLLFFHRASCISIYALCINVPLPHILLFCYSLRSLREVSVRDNLRQQKSLPLFLSVFMNHSTIPAAFVSLLQLHFITFTLPHFSRLV